MCQPAKELEALAARPAELQVRQRETLIVMSDQVPVWLKVEAGKVLRPVSEAQQGMESRKARHRWRKERAAAEAALEQRRSRAAIAGEAPAEVEPVPLPDMPEKARSGQVRTQVLEPSPCVCINIHICI